MELTVSLAAHPPTVQAVDALQLGPIPSLPEAIQVARARIEAALGHLVAIPDAALTRPWAWRRQPGESADVRYGFYHTYERLEAAAASVDRVQREATVPPTESARVLAQATAARWDLHGLLWPLTSDDLDRDPGSGEWPLRRTLVHVISAQRSYTLNTAYAVRRALSDPSLPLRPPADLIRQLEPEEPEWRGGPADLRRRLDWMLDTGIALLASVDDAPSLAAPTIWSGYEVDVRFRLHRWGSHFHEHAIQVEKTLVLLGRHPSEVERLIRLIADAYGRLEGAYLLAPIGVAGELLLSAVEDAARLAGQLRATASGSGAT